MNLSPDERQEFREVFLKAYQTYDDVRMMINYRLDWPLSIFKEGSVESVLLDLYHWADRHNSFVDLIWGAYEEISNEELLKITYKFCFITKRQWEDIGKLLSAIRSWELIERYCFQSLKLENRKYSDDVYGEYPELTKLKKINSNEEDNKEALNI